jgi:hypothetical protein
MLRSPPVPTTILRWPSLLLVAATLALGLLADAGAGFPLQCLIGAAFWAVLASVAWPLSARERRALLACLWVSTAGELLLSVAWGLYAYRLDNVPPFVPPGHVLMFLLAQAAARRMSDAGAWGVVAAAGLYAAGAAATGVDVFALPLFGILAVAVWALPGERRLLAATLGLSLALELYGTGLGIWTWKAETPGLGMATTNPPALSGALYVVRDAGVALLSAIFLRPRAAAISAAPCS